MSKKHFLLLPIALFLGAWLIYMTSSNSWFIFQDHWFMSVTMVFGSFIAGASSEGGGAVAFPVMTLFFEIPPAVARNFSFAIQSIGMTSATLLILYKKIPIETRYILLISLGGALGVIIGTFFIVPYTSPAYVKIFFVTLWLSFGVVLFFNNELKKRKVTNRIPSTNSTEKLTMLFVGLIGGMVSALLGSGIDILSFSYITLRYNVSEKIATPSSVIIMAINSIVGFALHSLFIKDFGINEFNYWLACIPIVIIGAPLGAYLISRRTRSFIAKFLYVVIVAQFIGAFLIIKPKGHLLWFSFMVFLLGIFMFIAINWRATNLNKKQNIETHGIN